jgi:hypothetical protein
MRKKAARKRTDEEKEEMESKRAAVDSHTSKRTGTRVYSTTVFVDLCSSIMRRAMRDSEKMGDG